MKKAEPPPPPKIKIKLPPPPPVAKIEPPKIKLPDVKLPDVPKPPEIKMTQPVPVVLPAPPKIVQPPPAPKVVNLAQAMPASVPNNSPHPTAVALGSTTNPIAVSNRPSTTAINLGNKGMSGMPASNNGAGAQSTVVNLGSGSPTGQNMKGSGPVAVAGVPHRRHRRNWSDERSRRVAGPSISDRTLRRRCRSRQDPATATAKSGPKVLFKPKPEYTAEANQASYRRQRLGQDSGLFLWRRPGFGRHQRPRPWSRRICRPCRRRPLAFNPPPTIRAVRSIGKASSTLHFNLLDKKTIFYPVVAACTSIKSIFRLTLRVAAGAVHHDSRETVHRRSAAGTLRRNNSPRSGRSRPPAQARRRKTTTSRLRASQRPRRMR